MTEIHYRPGDWRAAVTTQGIAILPATMDADMLGRIWTSLRAGHGLGAVLESLTGAFGTSLRAIPPFAVVTFGTDEVRLAVRGPLEIDVEEADARYSVSGAEVTTWSERVVRNPTRLVLRTDAPPAEGAYAVADGIVLCSAITVTFASSAPRASAPSVAAPLASAPLVAAPLVAAPLVPPGPVTPEETIVPPEQTGEEDGFTRSELPDDAYDHLWGTTVVKSVEHAAVRETDEEEPEEPARTPEARSIPSEPPPSPTPEPEPTPAPQHWTAPPLTGLIDSVPGFSGVGAPSSSPTWEDRAAVAAPVPVPVPVPGSDDHDGLTVTVSELEAMRRLGTTEAASTPAAPDVALGRMILSTGESHPLDRPVIIGRRPRANRVQADQVPLLVAVASPEQDISRNHLEVRIEGRHVLAVDLATTNGSVLHREGTPPLRLTPNEPVLLLTGDVIDLGDGVTVLFEDLP